MDAQSAGMLKGMIVLWSGSVASIPAGWALCNGSGGTPDLRNRFIVGAGDTYNPDASGGNVSHNHVLTMNAHSHTIPAGLDIQSGSGMQTWTDDTQSTGSIDTVNHLPPYYALCYIMKL